MTSSNMARRKAATGMQLFAAGMWLANSTHWAEENLWAATVMLLVGLAHLGYGVYLARERWQ